MPGTGVSSSRKTTSFGLSTTTACICAPRPDGLDHRGIGSRMKLPGPNRGQLMASSYRPSTAELERLFELSLDLLCVLSRDRRFTLVNPAFERLLGHELD